MFDFKAPIESVKNAFSKVLQSLPEFQNLNAIEKGKVVDANFKSLLRDLMQQFGMKAGKDYEDNLRDNEPAADFVIKSEEANQLIKDLLEGRITVVKEHTRTSKNGTSFVVQAHYRKVK